MSLVLASLALLGLGIFGPGIASGLVSGAPQLGAGAAIGTAVGAAGIAAVGGGAGMMAARGALGVMRAGTAMGAAASTSWQMGQQAAGSGTMGAGLSGMARAAGNAARHKTSDAFGFARAAERGREAGRSAFAGRPSGASGDAQAPDGDQTPGWARSMHREQTARHQRQIAIQALKEGDGGGSGANPDIDEKED
jgi:type IV secretion system protein TrbL